jgi:hypothetical protein
MKKLIAITDLGRVRILKYRPGGDDPRDKDHFVEEASEELGGVGEPLRETVSDQAGQFAKTGTNGSGMSSGEEHNLESEMERQALLKVATLVASSVQAAGCPPWLLVAPQAILRRLTNELPKKCQDALSDTVAADLTKVPLAKLEKRFLS